MLRAAERHISSSPLARIRSPRLLNVGDGVSLRSRGVRAIVGQRFKNGRNVRMFGGLIPAKL
jgi:hypothetical protein